MYYVYVLRSLRDGKFYVGYTAELRRGLQEHKSGGSVSTKKRLPFNLLYYTIFSSKLGKLTKSKQRKEVASDYLVIDGEYHRHLDLFPTVHPGSHWQVEAKPCYVDTLGNPRCDRFRNDRLTKTTTCSKSFLVTIQSTVLNTSNSRSLETKRALMGRFGF